VQKTPVTVCPRLQVISCSPISIIIIKCPVTLWLNFNIPCVEDCGQQSSCMVLLTIPFKKTTTVAYPSPRKFWYPNAGARFSKVPRTFWAQKAIRKTTTWSFCKAGLFINYVVKGIKTNITAKFHASRRLRFEDTKRIMSPEIRSKSFGTFEKQATGLLFTCSWKVWP